jgi:NTP pyrophosphatase (non-canonical NTP hydrolase)
VSYTTDPYPLESLAQRCLDDCYRWFPDWRHQHGERQIVHFALGIAGETGEVIELVKKWQGGRAGYDIVNDDAMRRRLAEELCDVLMYVGDLAAYLRLDLDRAMREKREANDRRFGA